MLSLAIAVFAVLMVSVEGHGRLRYPPSRSSMWRDKWPVEINYSDNQLFCGGFNYQWAEHGGGCGVCGDPVAGVKDNEWGGKYMSGIVVEHYVKGQQMLVVVEITANHLGYFEFRLCEFDTPENKATHACLDRHLLQLSDGSGTRYKVKTWRTGFYNITVNLPSDVVCDKCMLQWKYHAGNSYNTDFVTGKMCKGCGPQEEFYGCSDIRISEDGGTVEKPTTVIITTTPVTQPTTSYTIYCPDNQYMGSDLYPNNAGMDNWCQVNCLVTSCSSTTCKCRTQLNPGETPATPPPTTSTASTAKPVRTRMLCRDSFYEPTPVYQTATSMYKWCNDTCFATTHVTCPDSHCQCVNSELTLYIET